MKPEETLKANMLGHGQQQYKDPKSGLQKMREPFPDNQIGQLPKGTKAQNQCPASEKRNCDICGGWHHPRINHLSYVGHAAMTDRLLDADPMWNWEPMAYTPEGLPLFDQSGGLWVKLTVCGVTRLGYGHAKNKGSGEDSFVEPGVREKEVIGDALRNAGMRFGAALELWHKGELHMEEPEPVKAMNNALDSHVKARGSEPVVDDGAEPFTPNDEAMALLAKLDAAKSLAEVETINEEFKKAWPRIKVVKGLQDSMVAMRANSRARLKGAV